MSVTPPDKQSIEYRITAKVEFKFRGGVSTGLTRQRANYGGCQIQLVQ